MQPNAVDSSHRNTWLALLSLACLSVVLSLFGLPEHLLVVLAFGIALTKSFLVLKNFLHFQAKEWMAGLALAAPLLLLVVMMGLMYIDFVGVKSGAEMLAK